MRRTKIYCVIALRFPSGVGPCIVRAKNAVMDIYCVSGSYDQWASKVSLQLTHDVGSSDDLRPRRERSLRISILET